MVTTGERVEQLRRRYDAAFRAIEKERINLNQVYEREGKLFIQGTAPSAEAKRAVERRLEQVNPDWSREVVLDLRAPGALQPHTGQTVVNTSEDFSLGADDTGESE